MLAINYELLPRGTEKRENLNEDEDLGETLDLKKIDTNVANLEVYDEAIRNATANPC